MTVYGKKYANKKFGKKQRNIAGVRFGKKKFTPRPSSHALARLKKAGKTK